MGFDSQSSSTLYIDNNYSQGGVLILNEADKEKIRSSMRQNPNILQKFHSFLAYQIDLDMILLLPQGLMCLGA